MLDHSEVQCRFCDAMTQNDATAECDNCREVRVRVEIMRPEVLIRIMHETNIYGDIFDACTES